MLSSFAGRFRRGRDMWQEATLEKNSSKTYQQISQNGDPEAEPLYATEPSSSKPHLHKRSQWLRIAPYIFHLVLACLYTVFLLYAVRRGQASLPEKSGKIVQSPANSAITIEPTFFDVSLCIDSPFFGPPSVESDQAWTELLQYSHVRISGEDLRRINKTSIPLPGEEDAYWGTLGVTHELHCIKRIRQYIFKEHYFSDLTEDQIKMNAIHTDHCLEILRQSAMCRADVTLITMFWESHNAIPAADFGVPHACANWDAIQDWSKERAIDPMKPGYLQHPTLGAAFPDGSNHGIGVIQNKELQDSQAMGIPHGSGCSG